MIHFLNDIAALNAGHGCRSGQIDRINHDALRARFQL